jgi:hypothetical protein
MSCSRISSDHQLKVIGKEGSCHTGYSVYGAANLFGRRPRSGRLPGDLAAKLQRHIMKSLYISVSYSFSWQNCENCITPPSGEELGVGIRNSPKHYLSSNKQRNSVAWVRERSIPTERPPLVGEVNANFCGQRVSRGQRNGSPRRIVGFLDRNRYYFFQVAPQLYTRGWVDPVPDQRQLLRKSGSHGNRTQTSWSVARNSDH